MVRNAFRRSGVTQERRNGTNCKFKDADRMPGVRTSGRAGATREKANDKKRTSCTREPSIGDRALALLLEGKRVGETPACELQRQRCRPEASGTKATLKEKRKYGGGRYVYDSGGADLSCGVTVSDYDVRSSRCTLACPGCVLEEAGSRCAAVVGFGYRSTWWF
jgi:hypothetical protein